MREALLRWWMRRAGWIALIALASAVVPALALPRLAIDNGLEVWLPEGPQRDAYRDFQRRFGSDECVVAALACDDPWGADAGAALDDLAARWRAVPGVARVASPADLLPERSAAAGAALRGSLVGRDNRSLGVVAWLDAAGAHDRPALIDALTAAARAVEASPQARAAGIGRIPLAGTPLLNAALDRASQEAGRTFLPLAAALAIIVLALSLRSLRGVVAALAAMGVAVLWTAGAMAMAGRSLNMVTVVLPSLLSVLVLSAGIHLVNGWRAESAGGGGRREAMARALQVLLRPLAFNVLTTVVGFASLMWTDLRPVFDLGLFAALGMLIGLAANLAIVPGLLVAGAAATAATTPAAPPPHWSGPVGAACVRHRAGTLAWSLVLLAAASAVAVTVRARSDVLRFFPDDHPVVQDYRVIGATLTGYYTIEVVAEGAAADEGRLAAGLAGLAEDLGQHPEVARIEHPGRWLAAAPLTGEVPPAAAAILASLRHAEGGRVALRASLSVTAMESGRSEALLAAIERSAGAHLPAGAWTITGVVPLLNQAQADLVRTQINSLAAATLTVLAMIGLLFWSWKAVLAALPANLLPVALTFAVMALGGIAIDPATVMIAGVAMGLGVDDSIHFINAWRRQRPGCDDAAACARRTLGHVGGPALSTSLVAAAGFLVLSASEFRPVAWFGLLSAITMITAWLADVVVTPAMAAILRLGEGVRHRP